MYKVMIVDDEIHICMLLEKLIDWDRMNIQLAGVYHDGSSALQAIIKDVPDIVITDIMMPGKTGLEIVKECMSKNLDAIFLLISGHAEFEYAHMAIAYGVENYLLKPIDQVELNENLASIVCKLEKKKLRENHLNYLEQSMRNSRELLGKQFLYGILENPDQVMAQSVKDLNDTYMLDLKDGQYQIIFIKPTAKGHFTSQQFQLLLGQVESYSARMLKRHYHIVISLCTELEVVLFVNMRLETGDFRLIFNDLRTHFYEYCYLTAAISEETDQFGQLNVLQTRRALLERYNSGANRLYTIRDISTNRQPMKQIINSLDALYSYIDVINIEKIVHLFASIKQESAVKNFDMDCFLSVVDRMCDIFGDCMRKLYQNDYDVNAIKRYCKVTLRQLDSKNEVFDHIYDYIHQELLHYQEIANDGNVRAVRLAKDYVQDHLSSKITLDDIAEIVYMNPTYFSTLFKKETGKNFVDYVSDEKIKKAKELLKDMNLSIAEVGERVGYPNARYFSKVFMKMAGVSPSDYRKYASFL